MSSNPQRRPHSTPVNGSLPFASYAQIVRMLLPLTEKVSFYDAQGRAVWISDGLEEPELRMHVEILINRCRTWCRLLIGLPGWLIGLVILSIVLIGRCGVCSRVVSAPTIAAVMTMGFIGAPSWVTAGCAACP